MSYPLIGNYGITSEDYESRRVTPSALIVRDINEEPSNFRSVLTVSELLNEAQVPGISGVDRRKLVRSIRDRGSGLAGSVTNVHIAPQSGHIKEHGKKGILLK